MKYIRMLQASVAILSGVSITAFFAALLGALHFWWEHVGKCWQHQNWARQVPRWWLKTLKVVVYRLLLCVRFDIESLLSSSTQGPKIVEMNHGSFMEMFLGYAIALAHISGDVAIVVKKELGQQFFGKWLIVRPMQLLDRCIEFDRDDPEACAREIALFLERQGGNPDITIFILCDGTRPTVAKRKAHKLSTGEVWNCVLRPKQGGAWLLSWSLKQATNGTARRFRVGHGSSRPQQTEVDLWRIAGSSYWARIYEVTTPLPDSPEAYGPELTAAWRAFDRELTARSQT